MADTDVDEINGNKYSGDNNEITFDTRFSVHESLERNGGESEDGFRPDYDVVYSLYGKQHKNDIYSYNGKYVHSGKFEGFLDKKHKFIVFDNGVFKDGEKILDIPSLLDEVTLGDNFIVVTGTGTKIYNLTGKKVKTIDGKYLGYDAKHKKIAVLKNNHITPTEIVTYDYSDINNICPSKVEENCLINYKRDRYNAVFHGNIIHKDGEHSVKQTITFAPISDNEVLYTETGKAALLKGAGSDKKLYWSEETVDALIENMELFDKDIFKKTYKNMVYFSHAEMADKIQKKYQSVYGEDLSDELYNTALNELNSENFNIVSSCGFDRFMQNGIFSTKSDFHKCDISLTDDLNPCSAEDEKKLTMAYKIIEHQPEMSDMFSSDVLFSYLLCNPQKISEFDLRSLKTNRSDYDRDMSCIRRNQTLNMAFWDKGINILGPEEFMLACDKKQKDETLNKSFDIKNKADFNFAFFNLAYAFAQGNTEDKKTAEKLLVSLASSNREYLDPHELKNNNRQYNGIINNAAAMLYINGIDEAKSALSGYHFENGIEDIYLKKLAEKGIIKARAEDYLDKKIDFLCPVNQSFTLDSNKSKTNLLDCCLQRDDAEKIAQLLNKNADVSINVERYSKKQERNLPIKPFERYVDNKVFLGKIRKMRTTMLEVAENLDKDKETVIDKLFQTLSYKTRENSEVKSLQQEMHTAFREAHKEKQKNMQTGNSIEQSLRENYEKLRASHEFYLIHEEEFRALGKKYSQPDNKLLTMESYNVLAFDQPSYKGAEISFSVPKIKKYEFANTYMSGNKPYTQNYLDDISKEIADKENKWPLPLISALQKANEGEKSLWQRLDEAEWGIYYDRNYREIRITDLNSEKNVMSVTPQSDLIKVLPEINKHLTQEECRIKLAVQEEKAKLTAEKRIIEAQKLGLPDNISIWCRTGGATNCGDGWVVTGDGGLREPDSQLGSNKIWKQIFPGELVLSWKKRNTAAEHEFEVVHFPEEGLTQEQKNTVLQIQNDIHETWKDRRGLSSGRPSPSIGNGWNITGDSLMVQKELEKVRGMVTDKDEENQVAIPSETPEEHKRKLKEAKKTAKNSKMNSIKDLSSLAEMFKSHD